VSDLWQTCERHGRQSVGDCPECILEDEGGVDVQEMTTRTADGETFVKVTDVVRFFQDGADAADPELRVLMGGFCTVMAAHFAELLEADGAS
jgi:hypothetical protein